MVPFLLAIGFKISQSRPLSLIITPKSITTACSVWSNQFLFFVYPNSTNQKSASRGCLMWACTDSILSRVTGCLWWHCDFSAITLSAFHCVQQHGQSQTEVHSHRDVMFSLYSSTNRLSDTSEPIVCHLYSSQQQGEPCFLQQQLGGRPRCSSVREGYAKTWHSTYEFQL